MNRVFENGVLREAFGIYRDLVTEEWRGLYKEELHDAY
jgi:hypothetical protein